jgi:hypothetical protein
LRIVSEALWDRVHARLATKRAAYLRGTRGQAWGRPHQGTEPKYLLTGFARCALCGGTLFVRSRSHGSQRAFFYACTSYHRRGRSVCHNHLEAPMLMADDAVLDAVEQYVLNEAVVERAIRTAAAEIVNGGGGRQDRDRRDRDRKVTAVEQEIARLVDAVSAGGDVPALEARTYEFESDDVDLTWLLSGVDCPTSGSSPTGPVPLRKPILAVRLDFDGAVQLAA